MRLVLRSTALLTLASKTYRYLESLLGVEAEIQVESIIGAGQEKSHQNCITLSSGGLSGDTDVLSQARCPKLPKEPRNILAHK